MKQFGLFQRLVFIFDYFLWEGSHQHKGRAARTGPVGREKNGRWCGAMEVKHEVEREVGK